MNSVLERESKTDAVKKKTDRSKKVVEDVPHTTPGKKAYVTLHTKTRLINKSVFQGV